MAHLLSDVASVSTLYADGDAGGLGPSVGVLFLTVLGLAIWEMVRDFRKKRQQRSVGGVYDSVDTVPQALESGDPRQKQARHRLPNGRFAKSGPGQEQLPAGPSRASRVPWKVTASDFTSRASPVVEAIILSAEPLGIVDVREPLDVAKIELIAQERVSRKRKLARELRSGWGVALGAAMMVTCAGLSMSEQGWLTVATPGVVGAVTIAWHVLSNQRFEDWWKRAQAQLSSEECYWLDKVVESIERPLRD